MATFSEMITNVSVRLLDKNNVAITAQEVASSINDSISYWKFRRFWFNEVADSAVMTQGVADFPYPSDFLMPATDDDGFYIEYSGMRYPLRKISQPVYDGVYLSNGFGMPNSYARIANNEYQAYPIPDRDYIVGRHYLKDYAPLVVSTNETNDFTIHAKRLIELWTLANMSAEYRQDDKMETYYRAAADLEYNNLNYSTTKRNSTGRLTITSNLM